MQARQAHLPPLSPPCAVHGSACPPCARQARHPGRGHAHMVRGLPCPPLWLPCLWEQGGSKCRQACPTCPLFPPCAIHGSAPPLGASQARHPARGHAYMVRGLPGPCLWLPSLGQQGKSKGSPTQPHLPLPTLHPPSLPPLCVCTPPCQSMPRGFSITYSTSGAWGWARGHLDKGAQQGPKCLPPTCNPPGKTAVSYPDQRISTQRGHRWIPLEKTNLMHPLFARNL